MKNPQYITTIIAALTVLCGCSSVQTETARIPLSQLQNDDRFQVMVRTGNTSMDKIVYEMFFQQFSSLLPLRDKEPFSGVVEVTFLSEGQSAFASSATTTGAATAFGSGWYTGTGYVGGTATVTGVSTSVTSGGEFRWQNSTMLVVVKRADGERIWMADYNYKGGWEMSGFVVNTPHEAARLVIRRLRDQFQKDFRSK